MAYYLHTLISIIFLSYHQFIQTFAATVDIEGSSYKLSTEIEYAIYEPNRNDYLYDAGFSDECSYELFDQKIQDPTDKKYKDRAKWKIEKTSHGYAMKNVGSDRYLSQLCEVSDWIGSQSLPSHNNQAGLSWHFNSYNGETYLQNGEHLPIVTMKEATTGYQPITVKFANLQCGSIIDPYFIRTRVYRNAGAPCEPSRWVFRPLSLPSNCDDISYTKPDVFKSLELDSSQMIKYDNPFVTERTVVTPEKRHCKTYSTSFRQTDGSEMSYGFSIGYESPEFSFGKFSADFDMNWKYYSETENQKEQIEEVCVEFPSSEIICPPRTTCTRNIQQYKPSASSAEVTVTATCDGIEYSTTGRAKVDGFVNIRTDTVDEYEPMDCPYYTTDYNKWKAGTLQFCDTCNNDKTCEISRDGYILLDGVCIAESTCEIICGGKVRGGKTIEILGGAGPWSGGWCQINDYNKYKSDSCRVQLNNATPTQTAPGPNDGPSSGEECVNTYGRCGGIDYNGITNCCQNENDSKEWRCIKIDETWSQCNPLPN